MIAALLLLGLWPWLSFVLLCVFVIAGLEFEAPVATFSGLLVGSVLFWLFTWAYIPTLSEVFHWINLYWLAVMFYAACYVGVGVVWSGIKWTFYLHNVADDIEHDEAHYRSTWNTMGPQSRQIYGDSFKTYIQKEQWVPRTKLLKNKARLTTWTVYWPWSAFWTLLNDPIKRLYRAIYNLCSATYQRIADFVFNSRFKNLQN